MKGKSTDALMRHIRDCHGISIYGSRNKQNLLNMGYYHGYKAYRFLGKKDNKVEYKDFEEIISIYRFDTELKNILFPLLTTFETSVKNRLIDTLSSGREASVDYIYINKLNCHKESSKSEDYHLTNKLKLRRIIDGDIADNYKYGNPVITHFVRSGKAIPIWAYFEIITFGVLGDFVSLLNIDERIHFTESLGLHHTAFNSNGRFIDSSIKLLSHLRNAVMHNSIVFDCRFNINGKDSSSVKPSVENKLALQNLDFKSIVDYLVLLVFIMMHLGFTKTMLRKSIRDFEVAKEALYQSIPNNIFFEILGSDVNLKLQKTLAFIRDF